MGEMVVAPLWKFLYFCGLYIGEMVAGSFVEIARLMLVVHR